MRRTPPGHTKRPTAQPEPVIEVPAPEVPQPAPRGIPFGFYHVSWAAPKAERLQRQLDDLEHAAKLGATRMHFSHLSDEAATLRLLDRAHALGVSLYLEDVHPAERRAIAAHPALHAFSVADDANVKPPEELRRLVGEETHGARRYISIGMTVAQPNAWCFEAGVDAVGVQTYPFSTENVAAYWPIMQAARELASKHGKRWVANVQVHANGSGRWPTPEAVKALAWAAAGAGADEILWYALLDTPTGFQRPPEAVLEAAAEACRDIAAAGSLAARQSGSRLTVGPVTVDTVASRLV